ncbi:HAD family hydrolase [Natrialbaceae archaeon GCM10025810]|uniref:HAD family hydrolase n=1 Tax=Halovalidus salilacus TaxID=3075124 RepID=UPI003624226D
MTYDAVLFDFDGVIVETPSPSALYEALSRACDAFGGAAPTGETVRAVIAGDFDGIAARCRRLGVDTDDFCAAAAREMVRTQLEEVERGLRSAYDDVSAIRSLEAARGIVSDNHPAVVTSLLGRFGVDSLFETVYGCPLTPEGLERRKPSPANIEAAMADLDAESALYVGDRAVDVRAADNAGIDSAFLEREGCEEVRAATYRVTSLRELPAIVG